MDRWRAVINWPQERGKAVGVGRDGMDGGNRKEKKKEMVEQGKTRREKSSFISNPPSVIHPKGLVPLAALDWPRQDSLVRMI